MVCRRILDPVIKWWEEPLSSIVLSRSLLFIRLRQEPFWLSFIIKERRRLWLRRLLLPLLEVSSSLSDFSNL